MQYPVENRRKTDTVFMTGHAYLKLYPYCMFVYLKHVYTRNQPQLLPENVRRPWTDWYSDQKASSLDVLPISW